MSQEFDGGIRELNNLIFQNGLSPIKVQCLLRYRRGEIHHNFKKINHIRNNMDMCTRVFKDATRIQNERHIFCGTFWHKNLKQPEVNIQNSRRRSTA